MFSNNSSTPSEFFSSKKEYDKIFPVAPENRIYDIWYKRPYFGKIDTKGIAVYPKEEFLAPLDVKKQFKALNFVAEAFSDLQTFIQRAKDRNTFPTDFLDDFSPKRAWKSLPVEYDNYFEDYIFNPFLNEYLVGKKIDSFATFTREYLRFVRTVAPDISITQNEFIVSSDCTNKISGLVIDLVADDHGDNNHKVKKYLEKFEYLNFIGSCRRFGFRLNKHAPWQLIADLTTLKLPSGDANPMLDYAKKHEVYLEENHLFDKCYYAASHVDYENFKRYLYILYTSHYSVNSTYDKISVRLKSVKYGSPIFSDYETKLIKEQPVEVVPKTYQEFEARYGEAYFLKLYFRVRLIENEKEERYSDLVKNVVDYYGLKDKEHALKYIDLKLINSKIYKKDSEEISFFP
tara:strand:+ start:5068 stop:6276 length:1209 start_codon:yes stop_codon:yes gene_type:complete